MEQRVLAVREADRVAVLLDDRERVDALPPEVARVEVDADVRRRPRRAGARSCRLRRSSARGAARGRCARRERPCAAQAESSRQKGTTCSRNCHSQSGSSSQHSQETANTPVESPAPRPPGQPLIVTTVSTPSSAASSIAPAQRRLRLGARGGRGRQRVARGVDAGQALAVLAQLALQPVALGGLGQQAREIEVRAGRPRADAHLEILDPALGAPLQRLAPSQVSQAVGEQADPQRAACRNELWNDPTRRRLKRPSGLPRGQPDCQGRSAGPGLQAHVASGDGRR